jgi:hypothetical protein
MENITELIERLLEIQSGGRRRSPKLVAEDERLVDGLRRNVQPERNIARPNIVFRNKALVTQPES